MTDEEMTARGWRIRDDLRGEYGARFVAFWKGTQCILGWGRDWWRVYTGLAADPRDFPTLADAVAAAEGANNG